MENNEFFTLLDSYIEKERIRRNTMISMIENDSYINWLIDFTNKYSSFTTNIINEENQNNIEKLSILYDLLEIYAEDHNIKAIQFDFGNYYNMNYNDICFEIGVLSGQGILFFATRKLFDKGITYIDFNEIVKSRQKQLVK